MQTDTLELADLAIQHETAILLRHLHCTDAVLHGLRVQHFSFAAIRNDADGEVVELGVFG